jgi:hypothetical protein
MGTHDEKCNLSIYIALLSFIYSIKRRLLMDLDVAATEVSMCSRAVTTVEEEADVGAVVEETDGVESGEDLESFMMKVK